MNNREVSKVGKVSKVSKAFGTFDTFSSFGTSPSGFTLVELLVSMTILGILTTIGLGNYLNSQMKGRDAQRKSDLHQLQNALEFYNNDKGGYPLSTTDGRVRGPVDTSGCDSSQFGAALFGCDSARFSTGCSAEEAARYNLACDYNGDGIIDISDLPFFTREVPLTWGTDAFAAGSTVYMRKLPTDPTGSPQYCYKASGDRSKYQIFAKLENVNDPDIVTGVVLTCGGNTYNFGVTSPNTSLEESI